MRPAGMVFCRCCGKEIHESAPACPQCGGLQQVATPAAQKTEEAAIWVPVTALTGSILAMLALMGDGELDRDTTVGIAAFCVIGLVFGGISIRNQAAGKKMAIAAVILSAISLLALIGIHQK